MKYFWRASVFGILVGFLALQSCKKDDGPGQSIEDIQLGKLQKTWTTTSVTLDGTVQDATNNADYSNFTLTLSGTAGATSFGYSAAGRPALSPWPPSGNWSFGASPETQIIRDPGTGDELAITYSVTDTQLQITFTFSGAGYPARTSNVKGQWVFTFAG